MATFRERLKELRSAQGLSQDAFAKRLGLTQQTVANWESSRGSQPDYELLIKIADMFGVSLDYLLGRSDDQPSLFAAQGFPDRKPAPVPKDEYIIQPRQSVMDMLADDIDRAIYLDMCKAQNSPIQLNLRSKGRGKQEEMPDTTVAAMVKMMRMHREGWGLPLTPNSKPKDPQTDK